MINEASTSCVKNLFLIDKHDVNVYYSKTTNILSGLVEDSANCNALVKYSANSNVLASARSDEEVEHFLNLAQVARGYILQYWPDK